ncbi:PAS domain S-box-containing protein [Desulfocicer vacuolatum DSM 3385]|uniref:histidine kinase n=1 Tax=Desulfocicer vacuolatum DSM 3385 TaxID=1121400 RepID=A0A1W2DR16_9BACT|nr:PAS domain-containing sensor histidine kinase [Desulfocicer vacuolatum]SMC99486.1 PAS domain S-box-containing protein [Desulfocicer vacuolatum DSM 3385]
MIKNKVILLSIFLILFFLTVLPCTAVTKKKILILYSLQPRMPAYEILDQNFRNLQLPEDTQVEYFTEYLEQSRFKDETSIKKQADLINHRYKINKPDIVIAVMSPALNFIQNYCKKTFNNTPIVYALIDEKVDFKKLKFKTTGVNLQIDLIKTLKAALAIQPETRDVYVVAGRSGVGRSWEIKAKENFQKLSDEINFHYLSDLPMDEVLTKVGNLPPQAIVLYLLLLKDASGKSFVPRDVLSAISQSSSVPVYGIWSTYVGYGIIGGHLCSSDLLGKNVNKMVIRILNGKNIHEVHPISLGPSIHMYDWKQLKRFGIDTKNIPDENIILFKTQTVWEKYKFYIVTFFLFALVEAIFIFFLIMNIKKRKRAETNLIETQTHLKAALESMSDAVFISDINGGPIVFNEAFAAFYRFKNKKECLKKLPEYPDLFDIHLTNGTLLPIDMWALQRALRGESIMNAERSIQRKDTGESWMGSYNFAPIRDKNDLFVGSVVTIRDITALKKAEKETIHQKRIFKAIIDNIPALITLCDPQGNLILINKSFKTTIGWTNKDFQKIDMMEACYPDPDYRRTALEYMEKATDEWQEFKVKTKFGHSIECMWSNVHLQDDTQISIGIDITEQKRLKEKLQQAYKMESIGNLAGGIAHDFNNILSAIIGFTELSIEETKKGTLLEDNLKEILSAGNRAKDLVKQILTFARKSEEAIHPIRIDIIAKEVLKFIRSSIPTTIEITSDIHSESLIMGNPSQIYQVFMNLCTNAAHGMEDNGGVLDVSLKNATIDERPGMQHKKLMPGDYIEIIVSDTGKGINPDIINLIFEPYFTTKDPGEGTGMGLALVHGIINACNGHIDVTSTPRQKTIFTIYLPIVKNKKEKHLPEPDEILKGKERILLIDDEPPIAKMGAQTMERLGYSVTTFTDSLKALDHFLLKPDNYDLVISDMTMPKLTGDQLAIKILKARPDTPIILCTGYNKNISPEKAAAIGVKAIVYKPIVRVKLAKAIRNALGQSKPE